MPTAGDVAVLQFGNDGLWHYSFLTPSSLTAITANAGALTVGLSAFLQTQTMVWTKYTVTAAQLSTAGLTNNIELFQLAAKEMVHSVVVKASQAFTGGLIATYTVSVGPAGNLVKYAIAFNVFQAPSSTLSSVNILPGVEDFSSATSIRISAVSTVGNLNAATGGSVDVWILKSTLP